MHADDLPEARREGLAAQLRHLEDEGMGRDLLFDVVRMRNLLLCVDVD